MSKLVNGLPGIEMRVIWWYVAAVLSASAGLAGLPTRMTAAATTSGPKSLGFMACSSPAIDRQRYQRQVSTECLARCSRSLRECLVGNAGLERATRLLRSLDRRSEIPARQGGSPGRVNASGALARRLCTHVATDTARRCHRLRGPGSAGARGDPRLAGGSAVRA